MDMSWGCGKFLATVFVLVNLVGQLGGCVMVIGRFRVAIACGVLFFIVVLQVSCLYEQSIGGLCSNLYSWESACKLNKLGGIMRDWY